VTVRIAPPRVQTKRGARDCWQQLLNCIKLLRSNKGRSVLEPPLAEQEAGKTAIMYVEAGLASRCTAESLRTRVHPTTGLRPRRILDLTLPVVCATSRRACSGHE
jgi:hypothetical protein